VDIRGSAERRREDRDTALERLSFCGRPVVRDGAVYTTLVGRARDGGATELHVACFDLVPGTVAGSTVLRERWRTHVLDGSGLSDVRYSAQTTDAVFDPLTLPSGLAERYGRLYVCSNTGAVVCVDAQDGRVQWIETYRQSPRTDRITVSPTRSRTWQDVPVLVDGPYVHVAPRDSEALLRFAAAPILPSRSLLVDAVVVRGGGTARDAGSPLGQLLADDLVAVADGVAYVSGQVPPRGLSAVLPQGTPLLAFRLRDARQGEPRNRVRAAQIPETGASGRALRTRSGILFPAYRGIYGLPFPGVDGTARTLWRTPAPTRPGGGRPDRVGNLVVAGRFVWSVTPSRVVLFRVP
jgi:outer membrane protein assembly factor BamB